MTFLPGEPVRFWSLCSNTMFHGRIVRALVDDYFLVKDNTGLPPRPLKGERLKRDPAGHRIPMEAA